MLGAMAAMKEMEARDRFEAQRKKWIEKINGKEFLMVNCHCCGQPWARQEILRISEGDLTRWQALRKESRTHLWPVFVMTFVLLPLSLLAPQILQVPIPWSLAFFIASSLIWILILYLFLDKPLECRVGKEKLEILIHNGHQNQKANEVGLEDQYQTKFILMPRT